MQSVAAIYTMKLLLRQNKEFGNCESNSEDSTDKDEPAENELRKELEGLLLSK